MLVGLVVVVVVLLLLMLMLLLHIMLVMMMRHCRRCLRWLKIRAWIQPCSRVDSTKTGARPQRLQRWKALAQGRRCPQRRAERRHRSRRPCQQQRTATEHQLSNASRRWRPSVPPVTGSQARSGWGMSPATFPSWEQTPAMCWTEPFGLACSSRSPDEVAYFHRI